MNLSTIIQPLFVAANAGLKDKHEVLEKIADLAAKSEAAAGTDANTILTALTAREKIGSTGFGDGIAIPHCRLEGATGFVVGLITLPEGIDFESSDGAEVRIVAFIVGPASEQSRHLQILSALSLALSSAPTRQAILAASTPEAAIAAISQSSGADLVPEQQTERRLFQVVVQDESVFDQLLEVFE